MTGSRFTPSTVVKILFDGKVVATFPEDIFTSEDAGGTFSAVFDVPTSRPGQYIVSAMDSANKRAAAISSVPRPTPVPDPRIYFYTPAATILPGYKAEISGASFSSNDRVFITVDGVAPETTPPDFIPTDERGWFRASFWVPGVPGRLAKPILRVEARDSQGKTALLSFPDDGRPVLVLDRFHAPHGQVNMRGVNFTPGARVRIFWGTREVTTRPEQVWVSAFGGEPWYAEVTIPTGRPGRYEITARDESGRRADAIFDVDPDTVGPTPAGSPNDALARPAFVKGDYFGVQLRGGFRDKVEGIRVVVIDDWENRTVGEGISSRHGIATLPTPPRSTRADGEYEKRYRILAQSTRVSAYPSYVISLGPAESQDTKPPEPADKGRPANEEDQGPGTEDTTFIARVKELFSKIAERVAEWFRKSN